MSEKWTISEEKFNDFLGAKYAVVRAANGGWIVEPNDGSYRPCFAFSDAEDLLAFLSKAHGVMSGQKEEKR